jgi:hypothetical protein
VETSYFAPPQPVDGPEVGHGSVALDTAHGGRQEPELVAVDDVPAHRDDLGQLDPPAGRPADHVVR